MVVLIFEEVFTHTCPGWQRRVVVVMVVGVVFRMGEGKSKGFQGRKVRWVPAPLSAAEDVFMGARHSMRNGVESWM